LRDAYKDRRQIWKSLRTTDLRTDTLLLAQYCAEVEAEFARKRKVHLCHHVILRTV